jgi:RNA polymerase sigma-70 factor (ECF subfamily)
MAVSEEALVQNARAGDRAAFEELVRRTSRLVFARLYLETGDPHRAEDLLQETLLVAFRSLPELADVRAFRPWLLTIAQNVAITAARRELRLKRAAPKAGPAMLAIAVAKEPGPEEQVARDELRGKVLAVLRSLPEEYRLPLTLRYLAGADYETIQLQLGLTNGSLRGLLHRGLKLLRDRLPRDFAGHVGTD